MLSLAFNASAQNLLTNPGFETGNYTGWSQWQPANTTINNFGHTGSFSAAGWWQTSGWQDVTISNPNLLTTVGGWMYDDVAGGESLLGGTFASIRVEFKNASDQVIGIWSTGDRTGFDLTDNAWNNFTTQLTPSSYGAGITKATIVWEVNNTGSGSGRGIFDDMVVQAIPEPATLALFAFGLVAIAIATRRRAKGRNAACLAACLASLGLATTGFAGQDGALQNFEANNGTGGAYFNPIWQCTTDFEVERTHAGSQAQRVETAQGGGTVGIRLMKENGSADLTKAKKITVWVYDTQGTNTIELRLRDADGNGGNGADGKTLWSETKAVKDQWTRIEWDLSQYPSGSGLDLSRVSAVELFEFHPGIYYLDDLEFE